MNDNIPTPETDAEVLRFNTVDSFDDKSTIPADFARSLERRLVEAQRQLKLSRTAVKELSKIIELLTQPRSMEGR